VRDLTRGGRGSRIRHPAAGFTLIELLVVMVIIAVLLTLAVPYYFGSLQKSKEAVLRENLELMRESLDKHYGDSGRYPDSLDDLVSKRYLRRIPRDPVTESATTWVTVPPQDPEQGGVYDVRSGAEGTAADGTAYGEW
jgi:general secretion pathway protein G